MTNKWDGRFMEMALLVSSWSKDPKQKVGCVIVDSTHHILSTGYNGFPAGIDDSDLNLKDQEMKRHLMLHAEMNAVLRLPTAVSEDASLYTKTMYCTLFPCNICAGMIVQKNITTLWAPKPDLQHPFWGEKLTRALYVMSGYRVDVNFWPENELGDLMLFQEIENTIVVDEETP